MGVKRDVYGAVAEWICPPLHLDCHGKQDRRTPILEVIPSQTDIDAVQQLIGGGCCLADQPTADSDGQ